MKTFIHIFLIAVVFSSCALFHKNKNDDSLAINLNDFVVDTSRKSQQHPPYQPAFNRTIDILHTKLEVSFNWEKQHLYGKSTITLKPYFNPTKEFILHAKNFDIKNVSLISGISSKDLPFTYNKSEISVSLDKEYTRNDSIKIFIEYIAKPNERETKTGNAITSDKGLYFINPLGKEKNKPTQIWTQGEPESNSCWFPTIDKPNERMTQEIFITIDSAHKNFSTLSNGILVSSKNNSDGSRTDYWKQSFPSAPYLVMMAVGDYSVVKDKWKNMEVSYYVEKEFEPYTKMIFGNTPEMIEFFSNRLGVAYPWEKYSQVVVRDYVSGAMENTTAVIHGEFLNQTDRELLDKNHEDVISHELFHHWFGDYVTCESWSNLTLNEGFATYGEYLWEEYKYGRDAADYHAYESMQGYFSSASRAPKHLIRHHFGEPDEMFDSHSYNKGGAIIHMLRKYLGDEAFFAGTKYYLEKNKFSSVEAHDLRLAFEKVTGEDLNWFFDQWFFSSGHPSLLIQHNYNDTAQKYFLRIQQTQDISKFPVFRLPIDIDLYSDGKKERKRVWVNSEVEDFVFDFSKKPDLVNVDAEKSLLCIKEEKKSIPELVFQYHHGPLYSDRSEALKQLSTFASTPEAGAVIVSALNDKFWEVRASAIGYIEKLSDELKNSAKPILIALAKSDNKSAVRSLAIDELAKNYEDPNLVEIYRQSVNDKSYSVAGSALAALAKNDPKEALKYAKQFEGDKSNNMLLIIAQIYSLYGSDENNSFFVSLSHQMSGWDNVSFAMTYTDFLKRCSDNVINEGIIVLEGIARTENNKWVRYFGQKGIKDLAQMYSEREQQMQVQITKLKEKQNTSSSEIQTLQQQLATIQAQKQKLTTLYNSVMTPN